MARFCQEILPAETLVLGVLDDRTEWIEALIEHCAEGNACKAEASKKLGVGTMKLQVFDDRIVCLPTHAKPKIKVQHYVVNKGAMDVHKRIASLSRMSKQGRGTWEMPP